MKIFRESKYVHIQTIGRMIDAVFFHVVINSRNDNSSQKIAPIQTMSNRGGKVSFVGLSKHFQRDSEGFS
jgi:hypothetical protein